MPDRYDAAVFDLDGTLIDTESLCNLAALDACEELGLPVTMAFLESQAGIDDRTRVAMLSAHTGRPVDFAHYVAVWDGCASRRFAEGIPLKAGALDLLDRLGALGLPLALATSSRRGPAQEKLAATGLARHFRAVVTVDDVAAPKPAPDPYLIAARRLGADPARCVAFEDSETGARSARAAGLTVVQVPDLHPTQGAHAHHVAATLAEGAALAGLL